MGNTVKPEYHNLLMVVDADSPMVATVLQRTLQQVKNSPKASVTAAALPAEDGDPKSHLSQAKNAFKDIGINYKGYLLKNSARQLFALIREKQYDLIVLGIGSDDEEKAVAQSAILITLLGKVTCDLLIIRPDQIPEFIPPHFQSEKSTKGSSTPKDEKKAAVKTVKKDKETRGLPGESEEEDEGVITEGGKKRGKLPNTEYERGGGAVPNEDGSRGGIIQDDDSNRRGRVVDQDEELKRGSKIPEDEGDGSRRGSVPKDKQEIARRGRIPEEINEERRRRGLIPNNEDVAHRRRGRIPGEDSNDVHRRGKIPTGSQGDEVHGSGAVLSSEDEGGYSSDEIHHMMDGISFFRNFSNYEKKRCANAERSIIIFDPDEEIIREGGRDTFFYIILSGTVNILKDGLQINTMKEGDFFGEMAFLTNTERSTSVVADQKVIAYRLDRIKMKRMQSSIREKIKDQCIEKLVGRMDRLTDWLLELV
ncbi:MAG: cyclic nucleotide-binding domain-containing protein [Magnetococcales bacterium]|nr:cyclic nucleotide-binding domain-containing protein [Magnetococcales bacterium]